MFMLGVCYKCIKVCVAAVTSECRYFFQLAARTNVASGLEFLNFSHLVPVHTNIFTCLVRHVISTHFSLSGLESFENTSCTGNCNKEHSVSIAARSCLSNNKC